MVMLAVAVQPRIGMSMLHRSRFTVERQVKRYQKALERKPVATNVATGLALGALGDLMCQTMEGHPLDFRRMASLATFNAFYCLVNLRVFELYPKMVPAALKTTPLRMGMSASVLDNCVHSPLMYLPAFYAWTSAAEGHPEEALERYTSQVVPVMSALLAFWLPLQAINFGFVPAKQRVLVVCMANLVWNCALDYMANNEVGL